MKSAILQVLRCTMITWLCATPGLALAAGPSGASSSSHPPKGAEIFNSRCSLCHGNNGAGSDMGKSMNVPDLRSRKVQSQSNAALISFIREGKDAMPAFKTQLSNQEIAQAAAYVHWLGHHKVAPQAQ